MNLIDIHTHKTPDTNSWSIHNLHEQFESTLPFFFYSAGLHPWFVTAETWEQEFDVLENTQQQSQIIAIGECGLDRLCKTAFNLQELVFSKHIELANRIAKPLIIHCVRAYPETLKLLRDYKINVPVIFHGYQSNESIAKQIIERGYYLSFGDSLFKPACEAIFLKMPLESVFLETDESEHSIEKIYQQASRIRQCSLEKMQLQIQLNTRIVFKEYSTT